MDSPIFKAASLNAGSDPYEFETIASTPARDRYGDIVSADWVLDEYRKNAVVLWGHNPDEIVGRAIEVVQKGPRLMARLRLADEDTSPRVNNLRRLAEQKLLRAVSVGFRPGKTEYLRDADGEATGYRFSKNNLLEISLVSVPANPEALVQARALSLSDEFEARYFAGADPAPFLSRKRAYLQTLRAKTR